LSNVSIIKNDKRTIRGWAFFDWANSAYSLVISTAVFPPYFIALAPESLNVFGSMIDSGSVYAYSVSIAYLFLAFLVPVLSGISDYSGRRKLMLFSFTLLGSLSCISLFFFKEASMSMFALIAFIFGTIGFGGSLVFYNAYLPEIATEDKHDSISAKGYAYGYVGSVILLLIILFLIQKPELFSLTSDLAIRIGFALVGVWWFGFSIITFRVLPKDKKINFDSSIFAKGMNEVLKVGRVIIEDKNIVKFLGSYFFFIAGVNVVIYLATIFAKEELAFEQSQLIMLILMLQFLAAIGAYLFAFVSKKYGNKLSLMIQIFIWIAICVGAYFTTGSTFFFVLSAFVGLVFGGIQSLSRSTYSKMITDSQIPLASYFSFYDVLTKLAIVSGTFVFALVNQLTGNMRYSILSLSVFFIIAFIIMSGVSTKVVKE